jgi:nicotinate-nucleotide adenylyltransferase
VSPVTQAWESRLPAFLPGMRIGLFGGSFDPPHAGHVAVSLTALRRLRLDQVWWLVSPQNPLKPHVPSHDIARRAAAARDLATHPRIKVTAVEAALGTTYTADTLRRLTLRLHGLHLVWMMGADSLRSFHHWHDWRDIAVRLPIAVFNRPDEALPSLAAPAARAMASARLPERFAAILAIQIPPCWVFLRAPEIALSSRQLRNDEMQSQRAP